MKIKVRVAEKKKVLLPIVTDFICLQRGKKIREGDEFEFANVIYEVTK